MKHTLLLFLSANRLHAQLMTNGEAGMLRDFADTPDGRDNFAALLRTTRCPTYLLTDLIEEDFRHEVIPHLIGGNRAALLQRKFDQFYRGTPFRKATQLQRQKTGRRDDNMLLSALTNPALIMPWLNIMLAQQTPLAGIYSVPEISAPLVKDHPSNHLLLISWEKFSGLRQTYFSEHRLQISRLTPVNAELTFHDAVANELNRTYMYLKSLSLLPSGQTLDVRILCHANDRKELLGKLSKDADVRYDFADIEEIGKQYKINLRFTDSDASQIFLHQLAADRPKTNYANAEHTRFYTLWQLRRAFNWASAALLIASIVWSAATVWQSGGYANEVAGLATQTQNTKNETRQITQSLPSMPVPAADMKSGVTTMRKLDQYAIIPQTILSPISLALDRFPLIEVDNLDWKTSTTEPVATNTLADVPAQVILLTGDMHGFENNYRSALNYLERFQAELNSRGFQVEALSKPLDVSPSSSLADHRESPENKLGYSLKLVWRPTL